MSNIIRLNWLQQDKPRSLQSYRERFAELRQMSSQLGALTADNRMTHELINEVATTMVRTLEGRVGSATRVDELRRSARPHLPHRSYADLLIEAVAERERDIFDLVG